MFAYATYDYSDYLVGSNGGYTVDLGDSLGAGAGVWIVIAAVLALIGGILVHFLFMKSKDAPKGKFLKWLKDFLAFKIMWIEPILKIVYYIGTIFCILASFAFISSSFLAFVIMLICGPILIRLTYEGIMMFIMIWRNTQNIADNTKKGK